MVCFVDADLKDFDARFVVRGMRRAAPDRSGHPDFVKAMYDRPLTSGATVRPAGGGRVTELVARPLLNLHWPQLAGIVQPLGGEYAGAALAPGIGCRSRVGYGVEFGLLVDTLIAAHGLDAIAQVDVGFTAPTGTRTSRRWAGWRRRSSRSRWPGSGGPGARLVRPELTQFARGERRLRTARVLPWTPR